MRVAIVGSGGVAARHLGVLRQIEGLEVVGHVSTLASRAEAQAARWGGRAYTHLPEMLDRERPEAVWLCVTPDRHGSLELELIERGTPFFVEKPLAADLATAEAIAARLQDRPVVVAIGYKYRALDTLPRVRALVEERPARLLIGAWHGSTPSPAWWRDEARSGGQLVEQATHLVDLARHLLGEGEVLAAMATFQPRPRFLDHDVPQVTSALVRFGNVPATFTATCLLDGSQAAHLQVVTEGHVLTIHEKWLRVETGARSEVLPTHADPFLVEDQAFISAVRSGEQHRVLCDYQDALRTHRLCIAIREQTHP